MDDSDKLIYCTLCEYKTIRKDHFDRHMKQTHYKIYKTCEICGKKIPGSGLSRHQKSKFCRRHLDTAIVRNLSPYAERIPLVRSDQSTVTSGLYPSQSNSSSHKESDIPVSSEYHKIDAIVRIDRYPSGKVIVVHDEIKVGQISLVMIQKDIDSCEGTIYWRVLL